MPRKRVKLRSGCWVYEDSLCLLRELGLDVNGRVGGLVSGMVGTTKMRKAALYRGLGFSQAEAERLAGYRSGGSGIWRKPEMINNTKLARERLINYLEAYKAGLGEAAQTIAEGLKADRELGNGVRIPDWNIRHKFTNMILDVYGAKAPQRHDIRQVQLSGMKWLRELAEQEELYPLLPRRPVVELPEVGRAEKGGDSQA